MDPARKNWNSRQRKLRASLTNPGFYQQAIDLFLQQHIDQKVSSSRLDLVLQERAVVEDAKGIVDYWSKRTIAGLLLMPPTRHCFIHLNEALKIKKKVMK